MCLKERPLEGKKLCVIVTASVTLSALYRGQFDFLINEGMQVTAVSAPGADLEEIEKLGVRVEPIAMEREPRPTRDLMSLYRLWRFLRRERFDIVHVSTPKAGFLGAVAARLACQPCIVFTLRGRTYENLSGLKRGLFAGLDRTTCSIAKLVIPICRELGDAVIREGICRREKLRFVGKGSSNGIEASRFHRDAEAEATATDLRKQLGIDNQDIVVLFVGRIRREKGVNELVEAMKPLLNHYPHLHMVMVGSPESSDPINSETEVEIKSNDRIHELGWLPNPERAFWTADIVAMPSYREGFGNVALEAGAAGLPVVGFDIMGLREAIEDGESGILVPLRDTQALQRALEQLIIAPDLRMSLGTQGCKRVHDHFRQQIIWNGLAELYSQLA
ncbi:Putative glycosyltransferase EpsD [Crateriforma conspicua]|nr:Putative glycosyltransferase EpsD [Crateriforma conspicua]